LYVSKLVLNWLQKFNSFQSRKAVPSGAAFFLYCNHDIGSEKIISEKETIESVPFYKAKESKINKDGYDGQVCLYEVLKISPAIKELILNHKNENMITEQARKEGMMTIMEDGIFKAAQGLTTIEEVCSPFVL
jgi:type II secretory ATPase GspE/PulE/Tfp pilus assembly ATPase PilB-like protein